VSVLPQPLATPLAMSQSVNWVFTLNNPTDNQLPTTWPDIRYCVWQVEKGENGTTHLQGYLVLKKKKTLRTMKLLNAQAHWEVRKGNHKQAKAYCTKEDTRQEGPFEFGEEPNPGRRTDIEEVYNMAKAGKSLSTIADAAPDLFIKYHRGITQLKFTLSKPRNFKTEVTVIYGDTGVGKSRY